MRSDKLAQTILSILGLLTLLALAPFANSGRDTRSLRLMVPVLRQYPFTITHLELPLGLRSQS